MTDTRTKRKKTSPSRPVESSIPPEGTVERLIHYRRILQAALKGEKKGIFSHEIAAITGATSAQVRRDLMEVGFVGHPRLGYEVRGLLERLNEFFHTKEPISMVLVGVGNLGRALLSYFGTQQADYRIEAAFDIDPGKVNRTIHGCHCYPLEQLDEVLKNKRIDVGVIGVPASEAQSVAEKLIAAGAGGLLNLAPTRLKITPSIFVENLDLSQSIEKVSFFSRGRLKQAEKT